MKLTSEMRDRLIRNKYTIDKNGCLLLAKKEEEMEEIANFILRIVKKIKKNSHNGSEIEYEVNLLMKGHEFEPVRLTVDEFMKFDFINSKFGLTPRIGLAFNAKNHLRYIAQLLAGELEVSEVYTDFGFYKDDKGKWLFVHSNGTIGENADVEPHQQSLPFSFPEKVKNKKDSLKQFIRLLDLLKYKKAIPLLAYLGLAPLTSTLKNAGCEPKFLMWISGLTGSRKTSIAMLLMNFFGNFNSSKPPASFEDTHNSMELKGHFARDLLSFFDDYHPTESVGASNEMDKKAQRLIRANGDRIARGRATRNLKQQKEFYPTGMGIVTGEDKPKGHSSFARIFSSEIDRGDVDLDVLTELQGNTDLLNSAMFVYIEYLCEKMPKLVDEIGEMFIKERKKFADEDIHGRLVDMAAHLMISYTILLRCLVKHKAITSEERNDLRKEAREYLKEHIKSQSVSTKTNNPVDTFMSSLSELIVVQKIRLFDSTKVTSDLTMSEVDGWFDNDHIYLLPETIYNKVNNHLKSRNSKISVGERTLWERMDGRGLIETSVTEKRTNRTLKRSVPKSLRRKAKLGDARIRVIVLKRSEIPDYDILPKSNGNVVKVGFKEQEKTELETELIV